MRCQHTHSRARVPRVRPGALRGLPGGRSACRFRAGLALGVRTLERAWGVHDRATKQGSGGQSCGPDGSWALGPAPVSGPGARGNLGWVPWGVDGPQGPQQQSPADSCVSYQHAPLHDQPRGGPAPRRGVRSPTPFLKPPGPTASCTGASRSLCFPLRRTHLGRGSASKNSPHASFLILPQLQGDGPFLQLSRPTREPGLGGSRSVTKTQKKPETSAAPDPVRTGEMPR